MTFLLQDQLPYGARWIRTMYSGERKPRISSNCGIRNHRLTAFEFSVFLNLFTSKAIYLCMVQVQVLVSIELIPVQGRRNTAEFCY